jgi:DNA primase
MDVVEDPAQRALLAEALLGETKPPEGTRWRARCRRFRSGPWKAGCATAGADCRGRAAATLPELALLTQQKLELDRALRRLHGQKTLTVRILGAGPERLSCGQIVRRKGLSSV